jgi:hypothetical protein
MLADESLGPGDQCAAAWAWSFSSTP